MSKKQTLEKGFKLMAQEKYSECLQFANSGLEIYIKDPDFLALRGEAKFKLNQLDSALEDFNEAAKIEPENPFRFASRAFVKDAMGDTAGAVEDYSMAYKLDPTDATIVNNLGVLEEKLGYKQTAERRFKLADELYNLDAQNQEALSENKEVKQEKIRKDETNKGFFHILKKLFTSSQERKDFLQFVRNGFKLK